MKLIIVHKNRNSATSSGENLLRFAISSEPIASVILDGLNRSLCWGRKRAPILRSFAKRVPNSTVCAIPEGWNIEHRASAPKIIPYTEDIPICSELLQKTKQNCWFVISNGRFATQIDSELLDKVLAVTHADVVAVNAEPELQAYREKVRLTGDGKVAGFRRLYSDSAEPVALSTDWPHHIFIKTNVLDRVVSGCTLPQSFSTLLKRCRSNALTLRAISVGGSVIDLETENGLLNFCRMSIGSLSPPHSYGKIRNSSRSVAAGNNNGMSRDPKFVGRVLLGKNVRIGPEVVVVGPTIIGDNVKIEPGAVIKSSIIAPGVCVPQNQILQNRVVKEPQRSWKHLTGDSTQYESCGSKQISFIHFGRRPYTNNTFRTWSRFSYARFWKRIADFFAAIVVLVLFVPMMPFIALAIKLNSQGPVFFKDNRQGRHGKVFNCLKFRTMIVGADEMQDKLRVLNQADGPQFKIADDPRLSAVGRFFRDTYIDEVPQFFNVLLGQMSVVGPRPSPESENTLCPSWRDARLSVRPGITGLWQVSRTRQPMKDFQEWIHHDIKYVRDLSLRMDLWICWQTVKKMVRNFISQF